MPPTEADQQRFVATSFELLLEFVQIKRAPPLVLELLHVAKLPANVGDALTKLSVGGNQDEVVVAEPVGDDHLHGGRPAARYDHHTVPVLARP